MGLNPEQAEFATKKYKSHRSIPAEYLQELKYFFFTFSEFGQMRFKSVTTVYNKDVRTKDYSSSGTYNRYDNYRNLR